MQSLQAARVLDRLQLTSFAAQQQRQELASALRSLAADLTTLQGDAERGDLSKALADVTHLSSLMQVRASVGQIRRSTGGGEQSALRGQASSLARVLQARLSQLSGAHSSRQLARRLGQLDSFLKRREGTLSNLQVPEAQQQRKQALLDFLRGWQTDLDSARTSAQQGQLDQAKQRLAGLSLQDLQTLVAQLRAGGSTG